MRFFKLYSDRWSSFFFFNDTATTEIYTLSLHDALPIYPVALRSREQQGPEPYVLFQRNPDPLVGRNGVGDHELGRRLLRLRVAVGHPFLVQGSACGERFGLVHLQSSSKVWAGGAPPALARSTGVRGLRRTDTRRRWQEWHR